MHFKIEQKDFIKATASLIGAIVGAGIFGVPFVFAQAGFLLSVAVFLLLVIMLLIMHLVYGEIIERTEGTHRFLGYIGIYLGNRAKDIVAAVFILGTYGILVTYILLAESFFSILFGPFLSTNFLWGVIFWFILSIAVSKGLRTVAKIEVFMMALLIITFLVITVSGAPLVDFNNFYKFNISNIFLLYGVVLFALSGIQAVPELRSIIKRDGTSTSLAKGKLFKNSIIVGFLLSALITLFFGIIISGVSGINTSEEAISGLLPYLGGWVVYVGAILGILAISTSYLIFGVNLKESYIYDWHLNKFFANFLIAVFPIGLVMLGIRNFIDVASVVGSFFGAMEGILLATLFYKARSKSARVPAFFIKVPSIIVYFIAACLSVGGIYVIIQTVVR